MADSSKEPALETPPRTWRRQALLRTISTVKGNTSTDVEKTLCLGFQLKLRWKHLHGRGEDSKTRTYPLSFRETPPRTWRRLVMRRTSAAPVRNTSTDVEKTRLYIGLRPTGWKHLHGRGEDRMGFDASLSSSGNTSTDVEKTNQRSDGVDVDWKHLHGRGEDYY